MPEDLRAIRRKIRTVSNVAQITRAMKMVAAARLRRLQTTLSVARPYWEGVRKLAAYMAGSLKGFNHTFLSPEEPQRVALLVVAGDRGLCGSYNSLVFRRANQALEELPVVAIIGVGERVQAWARAYRRDLEMVFPGYGGRSADQVHLQVAKELRSRLEAKLWDGLYAVHTPFRSSLQNIPDVSRLVPIGREEVPARESRLYLFEPDLQTVMEDLLPRALQAHVCQVIVESAAAEQAARVTAMTAASDNAEELMEELVRLRNRVRQQEITMEMLEVVGGADAIAAE
jgi:F-type H+-transporting ATPase subunit gamma